MASKHGRDVEPGNVDGMIYIVIPGMPPSSSAPDQDFYEYKDFIDSLTNEVGKRNAIFMFETALQSREEILQKFGAKKFWDEKRGRYYTPSNVRPQLSCQKKRKDEQDRVWICAVA